MARRTSPARSWSRLELKDRTLFVRVRARVAGLLKVRMVVLRKRLPVGTVRIARPLTVAFSWRVPTRVRPGRYVVRVRFVPETGSATLIRRVVRLRRR